MTPLYLVCMGLSTDGLVPMWGGRGMDPEIFSRVWLLISLYHSSQVIDNQRQLKHKYRCSQNFLFKVKVLGHLPSTLHSLGFPGDSGGKESARNAGDPDSTPRLGRSPGEGNGNSLQYSCLENSTDRGAWWATIHGIPKSLTQLSD